MYLKHGTVQMIGFLLTTSKVACEHWNFSNSKASLAFDGMIIASGNTQDVYTCPASGYTGDQVSSFNVDTPYYCFGLVDDTGAQIPMVAAWVISADSNDPYYTLEYFSDSNCRNILAQPTAYGCCCSSPVDASNNPISAQSAVIY
jgi:hypothetical protein